MLDTKITDAERGGLSCYITATAAMLGLTIEPEWRDAVAINFGLLAAAASAIDEIMPADHVEAAVVFRA